MSAERWSQLTRMQLRVALRLAVGDSMQEIADEFFLSVKTIQTHRAAVLRKLWLCNDVQLARAAIRDGMVTLDEFLERARKAHIKEMAS